MDLCGREVHQWDDRHGVHVDVKEGRIVEIRL